VQLGEFNMKFISNKILNPAGDSKSFDDFVESLLQPKTAAQEAKPGTGIDNTGEPKEKGQVINTEGEKEMTNDPQLPTDSKTKGKSEGKKEEEKKESASKTKKTVKADCGKCMGDSTDAGKVTEKHTEAAPGDKENPEPKVLINNDPNYQKGESTKAKKSDKKSSLKAKFQKIASMDRLNKLILFASLSSSKEYPLAYVEAMTGLKFANMTEEEKSWMKDYWKVLYPPEYVEEMVKDR
jgi:hypothetical protein